MKKIVRYFIKHVLSEVEATAKSVKSEDITPMDIATESFI